MLGGLLADRGFLAGGGDLSLGSHPSDLPSERWEIVVEFNSLGQTSGRIDRERFKDIKKWCGWCGGSWCGWMVRWMVSWSRGRGESALWYRIIGRSTSRKS